MTLVFNTGEFYLHVWALGRAHANVSQYSCFFSTREPSKFVATLRHANPASKNPICMKLDMSAGHFSASDRYKYLKELSIDYSFLLDQLGLADKEKA